MWCNWQCNTVFAILGYSYNTAFKIAPARSDPSNASSDKMQFRGTVVSIIAASRGFCVQSFIQKFQNSIRLVKHLRLAFKIPPAQPIASDNSNAVPRNCGFNHSCKQRHFIQKFQSQTTSDRQEPLSEAQKVANHCSRETIAINFSSSALTHWISDCCDQCFGERVL